MSFVERYLRHPHAILAFIILGVVLGIKSFKELPLNLFPDANYPTIVVVMQLPGASAEDVEKQIAIPVEKEMATLSLVRRVRSVSRDSVAVISIEFEYDKGLSAAQLDVSSALDRIMSTLPPNMLPPRIFKVSDATNPALTIAIYPKKGSNISLSEVRRLAEEYIKPELLRSPDIGNVEIFGGYNTEVIVEIDRDRIEKYGINIKDIVAALSSQNQNIPSGIIRNKNEEIFIKIPGEKETLQRISNITISSHGKTINLKDIAKIYAGYSDRISLFHGNGIRAIGMNILRPETGNILATIEAAKEILKKVFLKYPQLEYKIADTQENVIKTSVSNLVDALRDAIILTVAVIFIFMSRIKATLLTAVSIPVTYFLTFFLMSIFGLELNLVTMTAVILAVGLLVDDSIVVAENIERHIREFNISPDKAAITGTQEIMLADLSGTFTTILVLIPIMFIGGYVEKILKQLAVVLTMALTSSYIVSITVIPFLSPYLLKQSTKRNFIEKYLDKAVTYILRGLQNFYLSLFRFGARHKLFMITLAAATLIVSSARIMPLVGQDLMPPMDTGILKVSFELAPNTPVEKSEKVVELMEDIIKKTPGYIRMSTVMGSEPGVISFGSDRTPRQGIITVHFVDRFHRKKTIWDIEDDLYKKFLNIPELKNVHLFEYGATSISSIAAPVDITISGENPKEIYNIALKIEDALYQVKGLTSLYHTWDFDKLEYLIIPDNHKLAYYGLDPVKLSAFINSVFSGKVASLWRIPEEKPHFIRVRFMKKYRSFVKDLTNLQIPTKHGLVPFTEIASIKPVFSRAFIVRDNLSPVIDILGYRKKTPITHLQYRIEKAISNIEVPQNVAVKHTGEIKHMKEAFARLKKALILSLILLYFSLVPTFRSFKHPLTIMIAIPLSLIGAIWALLVANRHFCMPASMGMILLSGVVVNNSILLIDFIEKAREKGANIYEAIEGSIRARTRPILMTAMSTIVGMIPIAAERAIGLERLSPLAVVAIGGLLVGTILTLVYVPIFYITLEQITDIVRKIRKALTKK